MAGGQLVPHQLPDGRTVMVPDYLLPAQQAGAAPIPPMVPMPGSPNRLALGPSPAQATPTATDATKWGPADAPPDLGAFEKSDAANLRAKLLGTPKAEPASHGSAPSKFDQLDKLGKSPTGADRADPGELARGRKKPEQAQGGDEGGGGISTAVKRVMEYGGGGGGPRRPGEMELSTRKVEREPGKELLPEYKWATGLEERPYLGEEEDPDAPRYRDRQTLEMPEPAMREKLTPGWRAYQATGKAAESEFQRQEMERERMNVLQREQLAGQSQLVDDQLAAIADRRKRVAELQDIADRRTQEATTTEPRTKGEIWESKGTMAQAMAVIAMWIGGYTQGLGRNGGKNPGWDMVNKLLDDEVEGERDRAERRYKVGLNAKNDARNDVERATALYGDLDMAMLDSRNRKLANVMAMAQAQMADRSLDETAKARAAQFVASAQQQLLEGQQKIFDLASDKVLKEEINYKMGAATGGGGGMDPLTRLKRGAEAKKYENTLLGLDDKPKANPAEQAELNKQEASLGPLKSMLARYKGADVIPGIQAKGALKRGARAGYDWAMGDGSAAGDFDSNEERNNRMVVAKAALQYRNDITGAGGAAREIADIDAAFAGARTRADLQAAVDTAEQVIAERRRLSGGGASKAQAPTEAAESFRPE